jgi:hypothetical protein
MRKGKRKISSVTRAPAASAGREKPTYNTPDLLDQRPRGGRPCVCALRQARGPRGRARYCSKRPAAFASMG